MHQGFNHYYLEVIGDNGTTNAFNVTVEQGGKIYLGIEYYNPRMYPEGCHDYTSG